jgi:ABC-type thiamine transport system substrate-binding protein
LRTRWLSLSIVLLLFGTAGPGLAAEAKSASRAEWEKIVTAAEKEGVVSIYIFDGGPLTEEVVQSFERAYPKIKVSQLRGRGNDLGPRLIAERRAGKHIADLFAGGKGTALATLYAGKILEPLKPLLVLPEVVDETKWWRGTHKYSDPENKYVFAYVANAGAVEINYNTKLVNPREFASYWDLAQPKWKGKIVAADPRMRGMDKPA